MRARGSGVAGGVVQAPYFQKQFGIVGTKANVNNLSSNVVAVLQGGAFFGALSSPPVSGAPAPPAAARARA